jgi:two-component system sensor histidine kinase/response regulator
VAPNNGPTVPSRAPEAATIPAIEGIDIENGLHRVAGNKRLYRNLIEQFAKKQAEAAGQITTALAGGDRQFAERAAHTVKGVAGNLGIKALQSSAERLERAIRDNDPATPKVLAEFAAILDHQVDSIECALGASSPEPTAKSAGAFNKEAVTAAVARLKSLLVASDADAADAFVALETALADKLAKPELEALSAAIGDFDFDGALVKLDNIARASGVNGGTAS